VIYRETHQQRLPYSDNSATPCTRIERILLAAQFIAHNRTTARKTALYARAGTPGGGDFAKFRPNGALIGAWRYFARSRIDRAPCEAPAPVAPPIERAASASILEAGPLPAEKVFIIEEATRALG